MHKLNCQLGDLAITVDCSCPENRGNIVKITGSRGFESWGTNEELLFIWDVEIANPEGWLVYESNGYAETYKVGSVPDKCLRRICPPPPQSSKNNFQEDQLSFL
jgi:hypothetical protein